LQGFAWFAGWALTFFPARSRGVKTFEESVMHVISCAADHVTEEDHCSRNLTSSMVCM
jgi:hypothetical protein